MSKALIVAKIVTVIAIASGVTGSPYVYSSGEKSKVRKSLRLGKADRAGGGFSLNNINAIDQLLNKKKSSLDIEEAGLTFGGQKLYKSDILSNPCPQESKYYLLRYVGGDIRAGQYTLTDGTRVTTTRCNLKHLYKNLEYINLDWARSRGISGYMSTIRLNECFFTREGESDIRMTCGRGGGIGSRISAKFGEKDYEYE